MAASDFRDKRIIGGTEGNVDGNTVGSLLASTEGDSDMLIDCKLDGMEVGTAKGMMVGESLRMILGVESPTRFNRRQVARDEGWLKGWQNRRSYVPL